MTQQDARQWYAEVTFVRWKHQPDDESLAALVARLPGYGIVVDDGLARVRAQMTVTGATARMACEAAVRDFRAAFSGAIGGAADITGVRVLTAADRETELTRPARLDLIGKSEAAQMLRVSTQRVDELSRTHPAFPAPIAEPKMGPIYTRASIQAFDEQWERRRTGRPRKQTG